MRNAQTLNCQVSQRVPFEHLRHVCFADAGPRAFNVSRITKRRMASHGERGAWRAPPNKEHVPARKNAHQLASVARLEYIEAVSVSYVPRRTNVESSGPARRRHPRHSREDLDDEVRADEKGSVKAKSALVIRTRAAVAGLMVCIDPGCKESLACQTLPSSSLARLLIEQKWAGATFRQDSVSYERVCQVKDAQPARPKRLSNDSGPECARLQFTKIDVKRGAPSARE